MHRQLVQKSSYRWFINGCKISEFPLKMALTMALQGIRFDLHGSKHIFDVNIQINLWSHKLGYPTLVYLMLKFYALLIYMCKIQCVFKNIEINSFTMLRLILCAPQVFQFKELVLKPIENFFFYDTKLCILKTRKMGLTNFVCFCAFTYVSGWFKP